MSHQYANEAASNLLSRLCAVADVLSSCDPDHLEKESVRVVGMYLWELADKTKKLVDEHWHRAAATGGDA